MIDRTDVWDIEIFPNFFCMTAVAVADENDRLVFVLHESRNDLDALIDYLTSRGLCQIGFNNVRFDYPVCHPLVANPGHWRKQPMHRVIQMLFDRAHEIINAQNEGQRGKWVKELIPQRDPFLIWHLDNKQRSAGLKWIQCAIGWRNVEDMPIGFMHMVKDEEIPKILAYNLNDVLSTRAFYLLPKTQEMINLRYDLSEIFGMPMQNWNNAKIGERIIIHELAKELGMDDRDVMQLRTTRTSISLFECILQGMVNFETPVFQKVLATMNGMILDASNTRKENDITAVFDGMKYAFGLGGIHAARERCTFHGPPKGQFKIFTIDVSSFYANLAIKFGFRPEHLGPSFSKVYQWVYLERMKWPKSHPRNKAYKEALVSVFGKSGSEWSPLRDPKMMLQITLNGQLFLVMLCEQITLQKAGRALMVNTDGIEIEVYDQEKLERIVKEWEAYTGLTMESGTYKTLAIRDVNAYIAVKEDGTTKEKNDYLIDRELYMDHSMKIVAMAVRQKLLDGTPVETTIRNHKNIAEFLMMKRAKTGSFYSRALRDGQWVEEPIPKTLRYYVSKSGIVLMKRTEKKNEQVHRHEYITKFNVWEDKPFEEYGVDLQYYIRKANELVDGLSQPQELLFA